MSQTQIDPGTSTWLRVQNDRTALHLLLTHGPLTRAQLGELSGMSKPTAGQMLTRLESAELIAPVGEVSGSRGPTAVSYGVRTDRITGVAVSMHGEFLEAVLVDAIGTEHPISRVPLAGRERSPENDVRAAIDAACAAAGVPTDAVAAVAIGVQAAVWRERDRLSLTDTLPGWPAIGSRERIEAALEIDATLENDVNLATMAERAEGTARDASSFALLWLGEGLGVGVDLGGLLHRGAAGSAGEIGYLAAAAPDTGEPSDTTDLLGGPAVTRLLGLPEGTAYADSVALLAQNPEARDTLADRVAFALDPVLAVLDPALVVLGGPTGVAGGDAFAARVASRIRSDAHPEITVRASLAGPLAVLLGARQLLVDQIRQRLEARILSR
ncbi:ROK family transcriptional regulator [Mycetocola tolaasinivorans]|uniref:ROK family transcriptional regulator n=1 Tax=Mycetocola tolaasinivorans TaxID=76635 RepID=A0A3L7ADA0_9MICO|nr:ROK family transcriptional regulator [Mycetocola tolaasinivorans]RLP77954.1 ROK family transcriptional regulator [Mycetocola tolaasinivorans]